MVVIVVISLYNIYIFMFNCKHVSPIGKLELNTGFRNIPIRLQETDKLAVSFSRTEDSARRLVILSNPTITIQCPVSRERARSRYDLRRDRDYMKTELPQRLHVISHIDTLIIQTNMHKLIHRVWHIKPHPSHSISYLDADSQEGKKKKGTKECASYT